MPTVYATIITIAAQQLSPLQGRPIYDPMVEYNGWVVAESSRMGRGNERKHDGARCSQVPAAVCRGSRCPTTMYAFFLGCPLYSGLIFPLPTISVVRVDSCLTCNLPHVAGPKVDLDPKTAI